MAHARKKGIPGPWGDGEGQAPELNMSLAPSSRRAGRRDLDEEEVVTDQTNHLVVAVERVLAEEELGPRVLCDNR